MKELDEILKAHDNKAELNSPVRNRYYTKRRLESLIDTRVREAVIAELEKLNLYYMRHDGEGEHKLAEQFDIRLNELKEGEQNE